MEPLSVFRPCFCLFQVRWICPGIRSEFCSKFTIPPSPYIFEPLVSFRVLFDSDEIILCVFLALFAHFFESFGIFFQLCPIILLGSTIGFLDSCVSLRILFQFFVPPLLVLAFLLTLSFKCFGVFGRRGVNEGARNESLWCLDPG